MELQLSDEQKLIRRAYSIGCSVLDEDSRLLDLARTGWLEFYIVLVRESDKAEAPALTPRLFLLHLRQYHPHLRLLPLKAPSGDGK